MLLKILTTSCLYVPILMVRDFMPYFCGKTSFRTLYITYSTQPFNFGILVNWLPLYLTQCHNSLTLILLPTKISKSICTNLLKIMFLVSTASARSFMETCLKPDPTSWQEDDWCFDPMMLVIVIIYVLCVVKGSYPLRV